MKRTLAAIAFGTLALASLAGQAQAAPISALDAATSIGTSSVNRGTFGWSFTPTADIEVTALGLFDAGADGLLDAHDLGLWDAAGNLLASVTVPVGTGATLIDDFRYVDLAGPLLLTSGQLYVIGAYYIPGSDPVQPQGGITADPLITLGTGRSRAGQPGLRFPSGVSGTVVERVGPNFRFQQVVVVGQPGSLGLFLIGLVALGGLARRRPA